MSFRLGRLLVDVAVLDAIVVGLFAFAAAKYPDALARLLPGSFGLGLDPNFTGNCVFLSLLLFFTGAILSLAGSFGSLKFIVGGVDDETVRTRHLSFSRARWAARIGALFLVIGFAALCMSWARADIGGAPLFARDRVLVANAEINAAVAANLAAEQIANAVLLDAPEIYDVHITGLRPLSDGALGTASFVFRALIGLWFFSGILAFWRKRRLTPVAVLPLAAIESEPPVHVFSASPPSFSQFDPFARNPRAEPAPDMSAHEILAHDAPVHDGSVYDILPDEDPRRR